MDLCVHRSFWKVWYWDWLGAGIPLIILYFCYNSVVTYVYTKFSVLLGVVDFIPVGQIYQTLGADRIWHWGWESD